MQVWEGQLSGRGPRGAGRGLAELGGAWSPWVDQSGFYLPPVGGQLVQVFWAGGAGTICCVLLSYSFFLRLFSKLKRSLGGGTCFSLSVSREVHQVKSPQHTLVTITPSRFPCSVASPPLSFFPLPFSSFPSPLLLAAGVCSCMVETRGVDERPNSVRS